MSDPTMRRLYDEGGGPRKVSEVRQEHSMSDDRFPAASDARDELVKARRRLAALIESHPSRTWPVPLINAVISVVEAQGLPAQVVSSSARQSCDRCGAAEYAPLAPTESTATASDVR